MMKRVSLSKYVELALHRAEYEKGESVDCVVAEVPDLPGCLTQGRTFEEARDNLKEAIELWTAVCLSKGKVPPLIDGTYGGDIDVTSAIPYQDLR